MVLKPVVNNGMVVTTSHSTGYIAGFLKHPTVLKTQFSEIRKSWDEKHKKRTTFRNPTNIRFSSSGRTPRNRKRYGAFLKGGANHKRFPEKTGRLLTIHGFPPDSRETFPFFFWGGRFEVMKRQEFYMKWKIQICPCCFYPHKTQSGSKCWLFEVYS